jgi:hypothetical protein
MSKRKTVEQINAKLELEGRPIRIIGPYRSNKEPTLFRCSDNHEWLALGNNVLRSKKPSGCPYCSGNAVLTLIEAREKAAQKGFKIVDEFKGSGNQTTFECPRKHTWRTQARHVLSGTSGCPHCANLAPLSEEIVNARLSFGMRLVGPYINRRSPAKFQCSDLHTFESTTLSVLSAQKRGAKGCPICAANQPLTEDLIQQRLSDPEDGRGIALIGPFSNAQTSTKFKCRQGHNFNAKPYLVATLTVHNRSGCPRCAGKEKLTSSEINNTLASRNPKIFLLSTFETVKSIATFLCDCGHQWNTSVSNVLYNNSGCPNCAENKTDNDILYLWRFRTKQLFGESIYKVGITSERLGTKRIREVAKNAGDVADLIEYCRVKDAKGIETKILKFGRRVDVSILRGGGSEVRQFTSSELQQVLLLIQNAKNDASD